MGKPSKGTAKDQRLKTNKTFMPNKANIPSKASMPKPKGK